MKTKFTFLFTIIIILSSCSSAIIKTGTAKSIDIAGAGVYYKPVIADLEINQKKTSKTIILKYNDLLENSKNDIISLLLSENDADLLIEPKYELKTEDGKRELKVTGWLAYYKNFKTIEEKDIKLLEVHPTQKTETPQTIILEKKK